MEFHIQDVTMTYPNGKQALGGLSLRLGSPSLTGLLGQARKVLERTLR